MTAPQAIAQPAASDTSNRRGRRVLRVGIVHDRRIVEERLLARTGDVTIGTSPRSTFIVPWDDAPARWRLFEERGGRRFLHLAGGMTARIADGTNVTSVDGGAAGAARAIPLSERARGKVTIGDTTVLFQLLRPPAPQPRPQLPISVRHRITDGIDRFFAAVVAFTLLLHVVLVVYLRQVDWPRRPDIEAIPIGSSTRPSTCPAPPRRRSRRRRSPTPRRSRSGRGRTHDGRASSRGTEGEDARRYRSRGPPDRPDPAAHGARGRRYVAAHRDVRRRRGRSARSTMPSGASAGSASPAPLR